MDILPIINLPVRLLRKPVKTSEDIQSVVNLSFQLHAITKMDSKLSNKAERVLIRSLVIEDENLRS